MLRIISVEIFQPEKTCLILDSPVICAKEKFVFNPLAQELSQKLNREYEYEKDKYVSSVVGRLRKILSIWKNDLSAFPFISHVIEYGYVFT